MATIHMYKTCTSTNDDVDYSRLSYTSRQILMLEKHILHKVADRIRDISYCTLMLNYYLRRRPMFYRLLVCSR